MLGLSIALHQQASTTTGSRRLCVRACLRVCAITQLATRRRLTAGPHLFATATAFLCSSFASRESQTGLVYFRAPPTTKRPPPPRAMLATSRGRGHAGACVTGAAYPRRRTRPQRQDERGRTSPDGRLPCKICPSASPIPSWAHSCVESLAADRFHLQLHLHLHTVLYATKVQSAIGRRTTLLSLRISCSECARNSSADCEISPAGMKALPGPPLLCVQAAVDFSVNGRARERRGQVEGQELKLVVRGESPPPAPQPPPLDWILISSHLEAIASA